jgi:hypothetical protein
MASLRAQRSNPAARASAPRKMLAEVAANAALFCACRRELDCFAIGGV